MSWNVSQINSAATVKWSNAANFDGFILLTVIPPGTYTSVYKASNYPKVELPLTIKIPIRDGVINQNTKIPQTASYAPPGVTYTATWYDQDSRVISGPSATFTVSADPYVITVPTLNVP